MKAKLAVLAAALGLLAEGTWLSAADFDGDSRSDIAIFRGSSGGLWNVVGITRFYFGGAGDALVPGDYDGNGVDEAAFYRSSSGLWSVRDLTRTYLGSAGDIGIAGGGGQKTFDYVVKTGDGADLVSALESNTLLSVFIPNGTYVVTQVINVDHVRRIVGESKKGTIIHFVADDYLLVDEDYCHLENIQFEHEAANPYAGSLVSLNAGVEWASVQNCRFDGNLNVQNGLEYSGSSNWLQVLNCYAADCTVGYQGSIDATGTVFTNCQAKYCGTGFANCENVSSSEVLGNAGTCVGYDNCRRLVACKTKSVGVGFDGCSYLSACVMDGTTYPSDTGFTGCRYISSCCVSGANFGFYSCTHISSSEAMSCTSAWPECSKRDTSSTSP